MKDYHWGQGASDLFLYVEDGKVILLDAEYDTRLLHEKCGGRTYYVSCSGCSGAGYLDDLGELLPIGLYRVDTRHNDFQVFLSVGKVLGGEDEGKEVMVAVPYCSHTDDKSDILRNYPTVIKVGEKVVYCDFFANFLSLLSLILSGEELPDECMIDGAYYYGRKRRTLKRVFSRPGSWGAKEEEVTIDFFNFCSMRETPSPWEFIPERLKDFLGEYPERMYQLLSVEKLPNGAFVKSVKIDGRRYRGRCLKGNPLLDNSLTAGWQREESDVLLRFYEKDAHLVAYATAQEAYEKVARRVAFKVGLGDDFVACATSTSWRWNNEYVEFEIVVPKILYILNRSGLLAEVRRGLARKVRQDIMSLARQWVDDMDDQAILEAIPDAMVITMEDSYASGNCRPGTQEFVNREFPGKTSVTARELKKFSSSNYVMRIFRYLFVTSRVS